MTDLVQRLRDSAKAARALDRSALLHEAADEIERLRLTNAEREAVAFASERLLSSYVDEREIALTLRGLLERTK